MELMVDGDILEPGDSTSGRWRIENGEREIEREVEGVMYKSQGKK